MNASQSFVSELLHESAPRPQPSASLASVEPVKHPAAYDAPVIAQMLVPEVTTPIAAIDRPVSTADTTTAPSVDAAPAPLPPPKIDLDDKYQAKALAAGLNPSLSRVLLSKLSAVDFRNADRAIRRALGSSSKDAVVLWPSPRKTNVAQFEVYFVKSASPECRRYIVKVAKDGWVTTAGPMEKCGFKPLPT